RNVLGQAVQHSAGRVAPRKPPGVGGEARQVAVPSGGKLAPLHLLDLGGQFSKLLAVGGKTCSPVAPRFGAARADAGVEPARDFVRHEEFGVLGPAIGSLGEPDL